MLGIPEDGPLLLVASLDLAERRKGLGVLGDALARLGRPDARLVAMGQGEIRLPWGLVAGIHALGHVDREDVKVAAYGAADLLVHPALADNLPNVVLEALACGTPVVSFAVGGLPEPVQPGRTGWLAPSVSGAGLAEGLAEALADLARGVDRRPACRQAAEATYALWRQAERYVRLYQEMLDGRRRALT
jgi:glycosyltransferase involved in cell wall biosynthesis